MPIFLPGPGPYLNPSTEIGTSIPAPAVVSTIKKLAAMGVG